MNELTRRKAVLGTAGLTLTALAGCVSGGDDDDGGADDDPIESSSISHVGSECAGPDPDTVTVVTDGQTYIVEGRLPSNVPCYEPELVESSYADGTLSLTVDIVETTGEDEACVDCEGQVNYEATVELSSDESVETVSVSHESGETHTVDRSEFVDGLPALVSSSIETVQTGSRTDDHEDGIDFDVGEDTITIEGTILTSTPHFEAVLAETAISSRELQVTVETESTLDDDEMAGTQQLGFLDYEATIEVENIDSLESATITHPNTSHGFAWDEDTASASGGSSGESRSEQ